jgi:hypothetical protein
MSRTRKILAALIALLGLWEFGDVVAPLVPGFGVVPVYVWNHVAVGAILLVTGGWAAFTNDARTARRLAVVAALAGAWLVITTPILRRPAVPAALWNDLVVGAAVVILAIASGLQTRSRYG